MAISIWEGNKAQALIDAINNRNSDYSEGLKHALLDIAANVAYTNNRGAEYYSNLHAVLYPKAEPEEPYTWEYNSDTDGMIASNSNYTVNNSGTINTSISNSVLRCTCNDWDGSIFDIRPTKTTNQKASFLARVKINVVPKSPSDFVGFRIQLSNGTSGIQVGTALHNDGILYLGTREGSTYIDVVQIDFYEWYDIEVKLDGATGKIYLNNVLVKTIDTLSTSYCTFSRLIANVYTSAGAQERTTLDVSFAKVAYRDED